MKSNEQQIRDEILLREASIADARRELAAGELSAIEAATIEAREEVALREARLRLEEFSDPDVKRRPSVRRRRWMLLMGLGCFLLAVFIILGSSIVLRQAGNSITGNVSLSNSQQVSQFLTEAESDVANGDVQAALSAYQLVLNLSPKNVPALTQTGWLEFSAGSSAINPSLVTRGIHYLQEAIADAPRNPAPRLYYAIVADSTPGNVEAATKEFRIFLALHPSAGQLVVAAPFLKQLGLKTS